MNLISNILLATGNPQLKVVIEKLSGFKIVGDAQNREEVLNQCEMLSPAILLYSESLQSINKTSSVELLKSIRRRCPTIRIVYLSGYIADEDAERMRLLNILVEAGIYDIYHEKSITPREIITLLSHPRTKADVAYVSRFSSENTSLVEIGDTGFRNVIIFSSIKPGSGKSFIAVNVAAAIAKHGRKKKDGSKPRVAIIEGDLQTLAVSTLLHMDDDHRNLKVALEKVTKVVDKAGVLIGSDDEIESVRKEVLSCFISCDQAPNLYGLIGGNLTRSDIVKINSYQYYFLIELIVDSFDIIIVDTNSALEHRTTGPLFELANTCFYIMDVDYNNVRNNLRYQKELTEFGIMHKVKYILNKDISPKMNSSFGEKLAFTSEQILAAGFVLEAKIPMVDSSIMYNATYNGVPLIFDESIHTKEARKELFLVADEIWPIEYSKELVKANEKKKLFGIF